MNLATYGCQIDAKYENQVIIKKEIQVKSFTVSYTHLTLPTKLEV